MDRRRFLRFAATTPAAVCLGYQPRNQRKITVSAAIYPSVSSLYVAHELGYFADAGLQVDIQPINGAGQAIALLAGGKIDVSFAALSPSFLNAIARGARVRIVAAREMDAPTCGTSGHLYALRDRFPNGLKDVRSLKGKRVGVGPKASFAEFQMDMLLRSAGLRSEDIQAVVLDIAQRTAALLAGRIDAMLGGTYSVQTPAAAASQLVSGMGLAELFPNFQYSHIIFGTTLLDGPPEIGAGFLNAYFRGTKAFLHGSTPHFLEDFARTNNMEFEQLRAACRTGVVPDGHIDAQSLARFVDWAVDKGYCEASVRNLELIDGRFLGMAAKSGGD